MSDITDRYLLVGRAAMLLLRDGTDRVSVSATSNPNRPVRVSAGVFAADGESTPDAMQELAALLQSKIGEVAEAGDALVNITGSVYNTRVVAKQSGMIDAQTIAMTLASKKIDKLTTELETIRCALRHELEEIADMRDTNALHLRSIAVMAKTIEDLQTALNRRDAEKGNNS